MNPGEMEGCNMKIMMNNIEKLQEIINENIALFKTMDGKVDIEFVMALLSQVRAYLKCIEYENNGGSND